MNSPQTEPITDWRGTVIEPGQTVIYGAPVGRSIALVEAIVEGFTKAGRVNVRVKHRAYGYTGATSKDVVHVGADRLTVVNDGGLPPTNLPTEGEKKEVAQKRSAELDRIKATHTLGMVTRIRYGYPREELACTVCDVDNYYREECRG